MDILGRTAAAVAALYLRTFAQLAARLWAAAVAAGAAAASVDVAAAAGGVLEGAQHAALLGSTAHEALAGAVRAYPPLVAGNFRRHASAVASLDAASVVQWLQAAVVRASSAGWPGDAQADLSAAARRVLTEEWLPALVCALFLVLLSFFWAYKRPGHALIDDDFLSLFSFASSVRASLKSATTPATPGVDLLNSSEPLSPTMEDFMQEKVGPWLLFTHCRLVCRAAGLTTPRRRARPVDRTKSRSGRSRRRLSSKRTRQRSR